MKPDVLANGCATTRPRQQVNHGHMPLRNFNQRDGKFACFTSMGVGRLATCMNCLLVDPSYICDDLVCEFALQALGTISASSCSPLPYLRGSLQEQRSAV